jgi:hypothetical protein
LQSRAAFASGTLPYCRARPRAFPGRSWLGFGAAHWSVLIALMTPILLGGCYGTNVPVITALTADDVGPELEYRLYVPDGIGIGGLGTMRFVRTGIREYDAFFLPGGDPIARGVLLRQLTTRHGNPVYVAQAAAVPLFAGPDPTTDRPGFQYRFYIFMLDQDGTGIVALPFADDDQKAVCDLGGLGSLARQQGFGIACDQEEGIVITGVPTTAELWSVLHEAAASGLLRWEDTTGRSIFDGEEFSP